MVERVRYPDAVSTFFFWVVYGDFCPVSSYFCIWVVFDSEHIVSESEWMFCVLVYVGELVGLLSVCRVKVVLLVVVYLLVEVFKFTIE